MSERETGLTSILNKFSMYAPLVSVVIPCFNDHLYLRKALDSINNQTYSNIEILIVDDGSGFETKKILSELKQVNLRILTQENAGPSAARNSGIKNSRGELILPLDADDFFEPGYISEAVEIFKNYPAVGMVTCHAYVFSETGVMGEMVCTGGAAGDFLIKNRALANSMFRRICWEEVGGYDEKMINGYEDWDFNIMLTKSGWKVHVIEKYLFNYRVKAKSRNRDADDLYKFELLQYMYLKHQDVFVDNYEAMIFNIFWRMEKLEKEKRKISNTSTYKLGNFVLAPIKTFLNLIQTKNRKR